MINGLYRTVKDIPWFRYEAAVLGMKVKQGACAMGFLKINNLSTTV